MEKNIILTTIPLSPLLINQYCRANANNNNNILFNFDIAKCSLLPDHIFGYLSNLKIDFLVKNYDDNFVNQYMSTQFFVGYSNLVNIQRDLLFSDKKNHVVKQHLLMLQSIPLFLVNSSNVPQSIKRSVLKKINIIKHKIPHVGVNFAHLIKQRDVLLRLIGDQFCNFNDQYYYQYYFDQYIYGGDKLIQFFNDNPTNLLLKAIDIILQK